MRKTLAGKTDWCKHTRNSSRGRRGTNRLERIAARNHIEGRVSESVKGKRDLPKHKRHGIEMRYIGKTTFLPKGWRTWKWYPTEKGRDQAMRQLQSKTGREVYRLECEYRECQR